VIFLFLLKFSACLHVSRAALSTAGAGMPYTQTGMLYQPSASGIILLCDF
jgi:hypothetical protein